MKIFLLALLLFITAFSTDYQLFISNETQTCSAKCDGSLQKPFDNIPEAFFSLKSSNLSKMNAQIYMNFLERCSRSGGRNK